MKIINRKASHDAQLLDRFEAGIKLLGAEVKAVRTGHADLSGSFVRMIGSEAYLLNAKIFPYEFARPESYEPNRTRKLLLHKKQIISLKSKMDGANLTLVPVSMYTSHGFIKLELALGKPKKQADKRKELRQKTIDRDIEEALKNGR
jgi:SsrA-binding protein